MTLYLVVFHGKYKKLLFTVKDADTQLPIDITTHTFKFTVKRDTADDDSKALIHKATSSGIYIVDGSNGKGQVDILPADTNSLPFVDQPVSWDLQITRGGYPEIVASGLGKIQIPVTRA